MKNRKINGISFVILFVILLMIVTVFAWKSCSRDLSKTGIQNNMKELILLTHSFNNSRNKSITQEINNERDD